MCFHFSCTSLLIVKHCESVHLIIQMSNQARWSVLQSYNLLKWHKAAHRAAVEALQVGSPLSIVIRRIEEAMSSSR